MPNFLNKQYQIQTILKDLIYIVKIVQSSTYPTINSLAYQNAGANRGSIIFLWGGQQW